MNVHRFATIRATDDSGKGVFRNVSRLVSLAVCCLLFFLTEIHTLPQIRRHERIRRKHWFRALDIEQIGHVYEGLLDHTAKRATEPFLGLAGTRDKEPEIPLAELEKLLAKGEADLVKFLKDETGKSENAINKSLKAEIDTQDASRFRTVCQGERMRGE